MHTNGKTNQKTDYSITGSGKEADRQARAEETIKIHQEYGNVFTGIGCSIGFFSLQFKDMKPYQGPMRCVTYVLQKF